MTSFINLLADDLWSDADIVNRTESLIRSEFSVADEAILNRKLTGMALGQYTLSAAEKADLQRFAMLTASARQTGVQARQDMALLRDTLALEEAEQRLTLPKVLALMSEGTKEAPSMVLNPDELAIDQAERTAAQAVVTGATPAVIALRDLRRPVAELVVDKEPPV